MTSSTQKTPHYVIYLDFDHTMIDVNSDPAVVQEFVPDLAGRLRDRGTQWTDLMHELLGVIHQRGIGRDTILSYLRTLRVDPLLIDTLRTLKRHLNASVYVASDANTIYIREILQASGADVERDYDAIFSNPGYWDDQGRLHVEWYNPRDKPHGCTLCTSPNLCKGTIVGPHIERVMTEGAGGDTVFIYVGDGRNDFCPSTKLRAGRDTVLARHGMGLLETHAKNLGKITATVQEWSTYQDLCQALWRLSSLDAVIQSPAALRQLCRRGVWQGPTSGLAAGHLQANIAIVPAQHATAFRQFCDANAQACPVIAQSAAGEVGMQGASDLDIRTDLPRYRVYRQGDKYEECMDISSVFSPDSVTFALGCSFSFESAMLAAGIPVRNAEQGRNVSMYRTTRMCISIPPFTCPLVVSMRPIPGPLVDAVTRVTAALPSAHGAPVHVGDPGALGIRDLDQPDYGDAVEMEKGDVPVFWACGVTAIEAARCVASDSVAVMTHAPGCMLVLDTLASPSSV